MLTLEDGKQGRNFLTRQIFKAARQRMEIRTGAIDRFRLLCNMLSSQPMSFNLFGPLQNDLSLGLRLFQLLIPGGVKKMRRVWFEYAPHPAKDYLNDMTAFDVFVEYARPDGKLAFVGIETKLTEPFSQKVYDGPYYRRWTEHPDSVWREETWGNLSEKWINQLWRDHLLVAALLQVQKARFVSGYFMLVHHPGDDECHRAVERYLQYLKPGHNLLVYSLDKIVEKWKEAVRGTEHQGWLDEFHLRYLDLSASEGDFQQ